MKIYRYNRPSKSSLDDKELMELIRYVNAYIGNKSRCCYPCTEHKIQDLSNIRFMSEGKVLIRGRGIYARIPFYKNWEIYSSCKNWKVYSRSCVRPDTPRFIVNDNGSYMLYELKFCSQPIFFDEVRLIGEI